MKNLIIFVLFCTTVVFASGTIIFRDRVDHMIKENTDIQDNYDLCKDRHEALIETVNSRGNEFYDGVKQCDERFRTTLPYIISKHCTQ